MTKLTRAARFVLASVALMLLILMIFKFDAQAQSNSGMSLQVAPSPLVDSVKPGESKTLELKIRNNGIETEKLKIELRSFTQDNQTGQIQLNSSAPNDVGDWVSFSEPTFEIKPGEWFNEGIKIDMPQETGFSYSFAILISRQGESADSNDASQMTLRGSVAVFTLINVDRADARRQLEVSQFSIDHRIYEYLPVKFSVTLRNTGNTIIQPYGNIFIQRSGDSQNPISILTMNEAKAYLLPDTSRTMSVEWRDGFPVYVTEENPGQSNSNRLVWNWDNVKQLRFGKYTAKLVGAYNDGQRDVPLEATLTFWVVPWRMIIGLMVVLVVLIIGSFTIVKKGIQVTPRRKRHAAQPDNKAE